MSERHPFADGYKALGSLAAGYVAAFAVPFVIGALAMLAFVSCRDSQQDAKIAPLVTVVHQTDSVRTVVRDTVTIYRRRVDTVKARSDALDSAVVIVNDSTLQVDGRGSFRPLNRVKSSTDSTLAVSTTIIVPPEVIADIRGLRLTVATQDTLIGWFHRKSAADSLAIQARDRLIVALKPPRCGLRCGFLLGIGSAVLVYKSVK